MVEDGLKVLDDYQKLVGSQNDKANRRIGFVDDFHEFVSQHKGVIAEIKADYAKTLDKVTDEEAGLNFEDSDTSSLALVEKQVITGIMKYEELVTEVLKLLPVNNR